MPTYRYKAISSNGMVVRNNVEEISRLALFRKLKANNLLPIDIIVIKKDKKDLSKKKKNISNVEEMMKKTTTTKLVKEKNQTKVGSLKYYMSMGKKPTQRDLVVFTQNFYLLKKANFNNVHALSTIIESVENEALKGMLEDILAGVEAGDYMYKTMEFYPDTFPYLYVNMIRVGELSGSLENSLLQAVEYLDSNAIFTKKLKKALIPNILQFIFILIALIVGTIYALPQVEGVIEEIGGDLEKATVDVMLTPRSANKYISTKNQNTGTAGLITQKKANISTGFSLTVFRRNTDHGGG